MSQYLFNGGLVDHGEHGLEVLLLLLAFKLLHPGSVHINRGCHEDGNANRFFGFSEEVRKKCGGPQVFALFNALFACLPVASVVDRAVLVVHGGLSRHAGVLLEHLRGIPMLPELPNNPTTYEEELLHDILWSKPRAPPGIGNKHGGAGAIEFGPDVTDKFLRANGLRYIIRSLTVPQNLKGYQVRRHPQGPTSLCIQNGSCAHPQLRPTAFLTVCPTVNSPPPPQNRNRFLFLAQLVAVAGGILIFGGGSYCV